MKYRIEILDAESSGPLSSAGLEFPTPPLIPAVGDYMPIGGTSYKVTRRDFFYKQDECVVCLQLKLPARRPPR